MRAGRPAAAVTVAIIASALVGCTSAATGSGTTAPSASSATPAPAGSSTTPDAGSSIGPSDPDNVYIRPEIAAARAIPGVVYRAEPDHYHVKHVVHYDMSPPVGGDHSAYWADCAGTVYPQPIANENAVHMLEHGAVWITYRPGLPSADLARLTRLVAGVDHLVLSPYPGLRSAVSLQAWDYQLFVDSAADPRIVQFIAALRWNPTTAPEPGAPCSQPTFKAHPSTFGHPLWVPAS